MSPSFGRLLLNAPPSDALDLEREAGLAETFDSLDRLLDHVVRRSLAGERVAELTKTRARGHQLAVPVLSGPDRDWTARARSREAIQQNGFWAVPEKASLQVGPLSTAWSLRKRGRFGPQVSTDERGRIALDTPESILAWSVLLPAAELLYRPIYLRTVEAGEADRESQIAEWASVAETLEALGISDLAAFETIRYGGRWSRLRVEERHQALLDYCSALSAVLPEDVGSRLRLRLARPLVEKYYERARKDGTALQKRVVIAALRPHLIGVWGGSWTSFVGYLGEQVHAQEHVATALPAIDLAEAPTADLDAVASATGTTPDEVAAVAAAVFGTDALDEAEGPDRVNVLRQFWDVFDAAHASQTSGSSSLWGLVDSGSLGPPPDDSGVYGHDLYRSSLPAPLVADIESLWSGHVWTRFPGRTVTEWSPHARMAEAFGPALKFWEGVALTAWFICEGPYSRTDFPNLPDYHAREIAALEDARAPVDPAFLQSVAGADRLLGPPQQFWSDERAHTSENDLITITTRIGGGTRRDGFEKVRDLITQARRAWASRYLDSYLRARRTEALEGAAERYHVVVNARGGKSPTLKQAARDAAQATNLWLAGDLSAFYRIIREKSPAQIENGQRVTRPPHVALADLHARFKAIATRDDADPAWAATRLLRPATDYVRWFEATGEAPGPDRIKDVVHFQSSLGSGPEEAWSVFVREIEDSCLSDTPRPLPSPAVPAAPSQAELGIVASPAAHSTPMQSAPIPSAPPRTAPPPPEPISSPTPWWKRILGR